MSEDLVEKALIEVAKGQAGEIYDDGLKPAIQEIGGALGTVFGLVNNVIFYPLKLANVTLKYKYEQFILDMESRASKIPEDKITEPPLNIVGPTMEALKYTIDTDEVREMYLNLLASSINIETIEKTQPCYVEIIKQMSPLDAKIFKYISESLGKRMVCAEIHLTVGENIYSDALPNKFIPDLIDKCLDIDPFLISASVDNLCRLGLITYSKVQWLKDYDYDDLKNHEYIRKKFDEYKNFNVDEEHNISVSKGIILFNDFSKNFAKICI